MSSEKPLRPSEVTSAPVTETAPHLASEVAPEEQWRPATEADLAPLHDYEPTPEDRWPGEWHAMIWAHCSGADNRTIAKQLGYNSNRVSQILNKPQVIAKIAQIRKEAFAPQALERKFAAMAAPAADLMAKVITGEGPGRDAKLSERLDASKWALEKVTGKAKQSGDNDAGNTVLNILQALDQLKRREPEVRTEAERNVIEIAAGPAPQDDWMDEFVAKQQAATPKETK